MNLTSPAAEVRLCKHLEVRIQSQITVHAARQEPESYGTCRSRSVDMRDAPALGRRTTRHSSAADDGRVWTTVFDRCRR